MNWDLDPDSSFFTCTQVGEIEKCNVLASAMSLININESALCQNKLSSASCLFAKSVGHFSSQLSSKISLYSPVMLAVLLHSCAVSIHTLNFHSRSFLNVFCFCFSSGLHDFQRVLKKLCQIFHEKHREAC
jgi:hypothetical protein